MRIAIIFCFVIFCPMVFCFLSCQDTSIPLPKPRIYPKVEYPVKDYQTFESNSCPFTMTIPTYFKFKQDENKIESEQKYTCWFDLVCNELNTNIHISYVPVSSRKNLDEMITDAFEMADKHNSKASYRDEIKISNSTKDIHGLMFKIDGPVASPTQFFLTDSTHHFIRGSLYFNSVVNRDSIAPIYEFLDHDIQKMIGSFRWK